MEDDNINVIAVIRRIIYENRGLGVEVEADVNCFEEALKGQSWFGRVFHLNVIEIPPIHRWIRCRCGCDEVQNAVKYVLFGAPYQCDSSTTNSTTVCPDYDAALRIIDRLLELIWEQFNIGHWKDVPVFWRELYCSISLIKIVLLSGNVNVPVTEIVKVCDLSLLTGCSNTSKVLGQLAKELNGIYRERQCGGNKSCLQEIAIEKIVGNVNHFTLSGPKLQIRTEDVPSVEHFYLNYFNQNVPVILTGAMNTWAANNKWNPQYFVKVAGCRTVPVEIGSKYTSEDWTQKLMTIEDFVSNYLSGQENKEVAYLAQHQLLDQIPELKDDIKTPEYCFVGEEDDIDINTWFGPAHTMTPTHFDPKHNILAQVFGTKSIILFPPSESQYLYPYDKDSLLFNTSQVDIEDPLAHLKYPDIQNASYIHLVLGKGSMLYMPPNWWHMVRSLSPSFSISFWFQ